MYQIKDDWIVFNDDFNESLLNVVFPNGIQKIRFSEYFNKDVSQLPNSITHLTFSYWFNQDVSQLPNSLTHLIFYDYSFKQSLNPYLYHLTSFEINNNHKHNTIMEDRCKINQHNITIRNDTLIDLLLKK